MVGTEPRDPVFREGRLLGRRLIRFCLNENFLWISVPRLHCTFQNNILYEQAPGHQILPHPMLEALQAMLLFYF